MATVSAQPAAGQRLLVDNVDWRDYSRLLRIFAEHPSIRMAYDRGRLEIFRSLPEHEIDGTFLDHLIHTLTEELRLPIQSGGSTTLRRRRRQRGIDPYRCYWIANEAAMRGKRTLDLRIDPPPDLVLEVGTTNSSLNRMGIYAALSVPEVWRFDYPTLAFHVLGANRKYNPVTHSLSFPLVTPADLMCLLPLRATQDDNSLVRQFRAWIGERMSGGTTPPTP